MAEQTRERRAPVQGNRSNGYVGGTIAWWEHEAVWKGYAAEFGTRQSAERIAERGGFGITECVDYLGHEPQTWRPS